MIPITQSIRRYAPASPRTRGDDPYAAVAEGMDKTFSLHPWG